MKDKCLILDFKNAGLFRPDFKDKHRMIENEEVTDRKGTGRFINVPPDTLLREHVANVLLVLCGERPVPSIRNHGPDLKEDTTITVLADKAMVEIMGGTYVNKDGEIRILGEVVSTTKAMGNSKRPYDSFINLKGRQKLITDLSWEKIKWHLGVNLFDAFEKMVVSVLGNGACDWSMIKVFEELYKSQDIRVKEFCDLKGVHDPYKNMLVDGNAYQQEIHATGFTGFKHWHYSTNTHGIEKNVGKLSGKIFVPVDDSDLEKISRGCGYATLLDGGLVTIEDVVAYSDMLFNNAQPVFRRP